MKVLIWILTIVFGSVINLIIGELTGVRLGTFLLYLAEFYIARALCRKWDERHPKTDGTAAATGGYQSAPPVSAPQPEEPEAAAPWDEAVAIPSGNTVSAPEGQIRCEYCDSLLPAGSRFCPNCGARVL